VQKTEEMGAKGRRMGVWIRTHGSTHYLSNPIGGSPSGAALRTHTARSAYPGADKWAQTPLISRHWTVKRWCNDAEAESTRIPYARHPIGSGIMVMITSGPTISAVQ
jgi:hypothetical protein